MELFLSFGKAAAQNSAVFYNNLVKNPGPSIICINEPYSDFVIRNNHVIARTTATPHTEGLFGFHSDCDFKTIEIRDNRIECIGQTRPLLRRDESYGATVENNLLINVSGTHRFKNPMSENRL